MLLQKEADDSPGGATSENSLLLVVVARILDEPVLEGLADLMYLHFLSLFD